MDNREEFKRLEERMDKLLVLVEETLIQKKEDKEYRERHRDEHTFLRTLIEEHEANAQFKRALIQKIISGGVWALIVALGGAVMFSVKAWLLGKI